MCFYFFRNLPHCVPKADQGSCQNRNLAASIFIKVKESNVLWDLWLVLSNYCYYCARWFSRQQGTVLQDTGLIDKKRSNWLAACKIKFQLALLETFCRKTNLTSRRGTNPTVEINTRFDRPASTLYKNLRFCRFLEYHRCVVILILVSACALE